MRSVAYVYANKILTKQPRSIRVEWHAPKTGHKRILFYTKMPELTTRHLQIHFLLHRNIRRGCPISPYWNGVENPENTREQARYAQISAFGATESACGD